MKLPIELKARFYMRAVHPGLPQQRLPIGDCEILIGGVRVGYVGDHPGAPIGLISELDESTMAEVVKAIEARDGKGYKTRPVSTVPQLETDETNNDDATG